MPPTYWSLLETLQKPMGMAIRYFFISDNPGNKPIRYRIISDTNFGLGNLNGASFKLPINQPLVRLAGR
jgi:hypothetical protein